LLGAGDVTGLDPRVVSRTWPRPGVPDSASNYLPLIELSQPDLPWRYSPIGPDPKGRLLPWLCLVALQPREFTRVPRTGPSSVLPAISVSSAVSLPNAGQSWAWAHVQVAGVTAIDSAGVADLLHRQPYRLLARLLCPRHLEPGKHYTPFLVPTF